MPVKKQMTHLRLPFDQVERIDDIRYARRLPTRSAAILFLIESGLLAVTADKLAKTGA